MLLNRLRAVPGIGALIARFRNTRVVGESNQSEDAACSVR